MKALLLKDYYMLKKYGKAFLVIELVFLLLSLMPSDNMFFVYYPCMLCGMIPVSLMSYDEKSKWDAYCSVLPYTNAQIVSAKYIFGLIIQVLLLVITGITQTVKMSMEGAFHPGQFLLMMTIPVMLSCLSTGGCLPFLFKFGVEKGKAAYFGMIGVICAGSAIAAQLMNLNTKIEVGFGLVMFLVVLAAIGLYALSWYLSIRFYEKREIC